MQLKKVFGALVIGTRIESRCLHALRIHWCKMVVECTRTIKKPDHFDLTPASEKGTYYLINVTDRVDRT